MVTLIKTESNCLYDAYVEKRLLDSGITYEVSHDNPYPSISPPLIIVDGVPLDMERADKWIEMQKGQ